MWAGESIKNSSPSLEEPDWDCNMPSNIVGSQLRCTLQTGVSGVLEQSEVIVAIQAKGKFTSLLLGWSAQENYSTHTTGLQEKFKVTVPSPSLNDPETV